MDGNYVNTLLRRSTEIAFGERVDLIYNRPVCEVPSARKRLQVVVSKHVKILKTPEHFLLHTGSGGFVKKEGRSSK